MYQIFNIKIKENAIKISERLKGRIFLWSKLFGSKHLGMNRNLEQPEKLSLIARLLEMIPSKQLSGIHSYIISYTFIAHHLTLSSSFRRRICELVPLVVDIARYSVILTCELKYDHNFWHLSDFQNLLGTLSVNVFPFITEKDHFNLIEIKGDMSF